MTAHTADNEQARLAALDRYDILDTSPEETFERITRLVSQILDVPMCAVTLIDGHRRWCKSRRGIPNLEAPRNIAICTPTLFHTAPHIVPDTLADASLCTHRLVVGEPFLRFYAGVPLRSADGHNVGVLCATDIKPRVLNEMQIQVLCDLAEIVVNELELRALAVLDKPTGALSRRLFREQAAQAASAAVRNRRALGCIVLNLDSPAVRDVSKREALLKESVAAIRSETQSSDMVGRLDGEALAVLLPGQDGRQAFETAKRLQTAIATRLAAAGLDGSARCGVAQLDTLVSTAPGLLRLAQSACEAGAADEGNGGCTLAEQSSAAIGNFGDHVLIAGHISDAVDLTVDCTVQGLCGTGATLSVSDSSSIPADFTLQFDARGPKRACHTVDKDPTHLWVSFVDAGAGRAMDREQALFARM